MCAYRDAQTRNLKIQILSIFAYRHTMKKLQAFHEPYVKVSMRQIKVARSHYFNYIANSSLSSFLYILISITVSHQKVDLFTTDYCIL